MKKVKNLNYRKEAYRGTIKQIMKVRGLRAISLYNYRNWKGSSNDENEVHSIKFDIQDGYVNIYGGKLNSRNKFVCGDIIPDVSTDVYEKAYYDVMNLLSEEDKIPSKIKRNILVRVYR